MEDFITSTIIDRDGVEHEVEIPLYMTMSYMEVCKMYELPVEGTCGGMALCASCHCYVESNNELSEPTDDELNMLDSAFFVKENSRLACQIKASEITQGLVLRLAPVG